MMEAERDFNLKLYQYLMDNNYSIFLPQKECSEAQSKKIYETCLSELRSASVVVALLDGADADSGTCWECGYAVSQNIPVIAVRTDWRESGDTRGFNAMLYYSAAKIIEARDDVFGKILEAIITLLQ